MKCKEMRSLRRSRTNLYGDKEAPKSTQHYAFFQRFPNLLHIFHFCEKHREGDKQLEACRLTRVCESNPASPRM